jgi:hypothetical protein
MAIEAAAISIIDRLIHLLTLKERNREKFFNNFIEPLYRDAEPVAKGHMGLLAELSHRLERAGSTDDLIPWLEQRRTSYQAVRMKIRALLENPLFAEKPPVKRADSTPAVHHWDLGADERRHFARGQFFRRGRLRANGGIWIFQPYGAFSARTDAICVSCRCDRKQSAGGSSSEGKGPEDSY